LGGDLPTLGGAAIRGHGAPRRRACDELRERAGFPPARLLYPFPINPFLAAPGPAATSFHDTTPLHETLARLVEFEGIETRDVRLSVGVTNVESGGLDFFDTHRSGGRFGPGHVVARGSLPPGFPATVIDGKSYWDGGCVSNSPPRAIADDIPSGHGVVVVIDPWSARGLVLDTMAAVEWRAKHIQYASITPTHVVAMAAKVKLWEARGRLGRSRTQDAADRLDIVHIIDLPPHDQIPSSDAEFSRSSIAARRAAGLHDMRRAFAGWPWHRAEDPDHLGCLIHRVTPDGVDTFSWKRQASSFRARQPAGRPK